MTNSLHKIDLDDERLKDRLLLILLCISLALMFYIQYPSLVDDNKIQDDGRQALYWMARFYDADLFRGDFNTELQTREIEFKGLRFIYDYKNIGFSAMYYLASFILSPVFFNKLLPFFLMFVCILYAFRLGRIIAGNTCGLILAVSFVLFNANPSGFSISQGFQRSFAFPLLFVVTFYLISKKYIKAAIIIIVGYLIYPMISLVLLLTYGISILFALLRTREKSSVLKRAGIPFAAIIIAVAIISSWILIESSHGPDVELSGTDTYGEWMDETSLSKNPVYGPHGRFHVFREGSVLGLPSYLIVGPGGLFTRSAWGFMGRNILPLIMLSIFVFLIAWFSAFRIKGEIWLLLLSSIVMFITAWIVALWTEKFVIFFPSRYTSTAIPFFLLLFISANFKNCASKLELKQRRVLLMLVGLAIILAMALITPRFLGDTFSADGILRESTIRAIQIIRLSAAVLGTFIALYSILISFLIKARDSESVPRLVGNSFLVILALIICAAYVTGISDVGVLSPTPEELELYHFLSTLPKMSYLAGHPWDMDNIPLYAKRKVFDNSEFSFEEIRLFDLFGAYYSTSPGEVIEFSKRYGVDYWVINKNRFSQKYLDKGRIYLEPFNQFILEKISDDRNFVLSGIPAKAKLFEIGDYYVIENDAVEE